MDHEHETLAAVQRELDGAAWASDWLPAHLIPVPARPQRRRVAAESTVREAAQAARVQA